MSLLELEESPAEHEHDDVFISDSTLGVKSKLILPPLPPYPPEHELALGGYDLLVES